ncbi:hypothetical protein [Halobacillus seohaensis]|uniref:PI-PLC Y-box domain-containing protein n=1 Tax=Halobacillus seohaensis TaxID=447421 RepID=A0ABW2EPH8_9BACI
MSNVQQLIRRDGIRQLVTGGILIALMIFFIVAIFLTGFSSLLLSSIYSIVFGIMGIAVFRSGWRDYLQANNSEGFIKDSTHDVFDQLPARMYIGHEFSTIFHACLYDMDGKLYSEIKQSQQFDLKFFRPFILWFSGSSMMPASYQMYGENGQPSYSIDKKGGFHYKGYVQHPEGVFIAYTTHEKQKKSGRSIYRYIEGDDCRWQAEGDAVIGHLQVKDEEGRLWAMIKRDAIPREAVDRFEKTPGYLVEWKIRKQVPHSLIAFLFLLQTNTGV